MNLYAGYKYIIYMLIDTMDTLYIEYNIYLIGLNII